MSKQTDQLTFNGRTGHMLKYAPDERRKLRELVTAAQNAERQRRIKASPRSASVTFLACLEVSALRRVS